MEHYVGIDVSLELSSVCVVDGRGKIVKEGQWLFVPLATNQSPAIAVNPACQISFRRPGNGDGARTGRRHAAAGVAIASRYGELVEDHRAARSIFPRLRR